MAKKKKVFVLMSRVIPMRLFNRIIKRKITSENKKDCPYIINYGSQYGVKRQTHDIKKVFPLKQGVFEGKKYNIPNDTDYVLSNIYGKNYMELPPIEKRKTHNPLKIVFEDGEEVIFDEKI